MFKHLVSSIVAEKNDGQRQEPAETWDYWFCAGTCCVLGMWLVQRADNGWRMQESEQGPAWKIAADQPICPRCGGRLQAAACSLSVETHY